MPSDWSFNLHQHHYLASRILLLCYISLVSCNLFCPRLKSDCSQASEFVVDTMCPADLHYVDYAPKHGGGRTYDFRIYDAKPRLLGLSRKVNPVHTYVSFQHLRVEDIRFQIHRQARSQESASKVELEAASSNARNLPGTDCIDFCMKPQQACTRETSCSVKNEDPFCRKPLTPARGSLSRPQQHLWRRILCLQSPADAVVAAAST